MQGVSIMQRSGIFLISALMLSVHAAGCTRVALDRSAAAPTSGDEDPFPPGPYPDRDVPLAKQLVEAGALLLDVRSAEEFESGHIDGAVNIPHTEINARIEEIRALQGGDEHRPVVVYCRTGHRAGLAKHDLEAAGFDRVTNFGGIDDWYDSSE